MAETKAQSASAARGRSRSGRTPVAPTGAPAAPKKKRTPPAQFFREVRAEARKITWTSRKETWITSVMVFMMVGLAVLFFWIVDFALGFGSSLLIRIGT